MKWLQNEFGLYVPDGSLGVHDHKPVRQREDIVTRINIFINVATTLFAVLGFLLAYLAFRDQQGVNRSQQSINRQQEERIERRYADRVSWWDQPKKDGAVIVYIQNRSTAPINSVTVGGQYSVDRSDWSSRNSGESMLYVMDIGDIPPCTSTKFSLDAIREQQSGWKTSMIGFRDPVKAWVRYDHDPEGAFTFFPGSDGRKVLRSNGGAADYLKLAKPSRRVILLGDFLRSSREDRPASDCGDST